MIKSLCVCLYAYVCACANKCVCMNECFSMYIYVCVSMCESICKCVCVSVCMYVCFYAYMFACAPTHQALALCADMWPEVLIARNLFVNDFKL